MRWIFLLFCFLTVSISQQLTAQTTSIRSFDDLVAYLFTSSYLYQDGELRISQAKRERVAALYGIIEPNGGGNVSYTHNTQLPVSLLPAEIFGGPEGTFEEVEFGLPYVGEIGVNLEFYLFNLTGWEQLNQSKLRIAQATSNQKIAVQDFKKDVAAVYYEIVTLQEQSNALQTNLLVADTLYQLTQIKFSRPAS
ncbi:MAG: TolC family protein [Bacteroidota bacterium]